MADIAKQSMYQYGGNFKDKLIKDIIQKYCPFKSSSSSFNSYESDVINYEDLPIELQELCRIGSSQLGKEEYLKTNPKVIIERRENRLKAKKPTSCCMKLINTTDSHNLAVHADHEGPAGGPCYSILYYYHIDNNIREGNLYFYEDDTKPPVCNFDPKTGDLISFDDGVYHCPGQFYTESKTPVVRGLLGMFVLL